MSEALAERLSRFTPDAGGLDRDALLFAAGRASARPARRWQALAGALAACQVLTLALLWPRTPAPPAPAVATTRAPAAHPAPPPAALDPSSLAEVRRRWLESEGEPDRPAPGERLAPDPPPLRAFGVEAPGIMD